MAQNPKLHTKKVSELVDREWNDEWINPVKLKEWAVAVIKECCPEKKPYSLGASPSRCDVCEFLMDRFEITDEEIE